MHFLGKPSTWILLILGIWLNCEYNYSVERIHGVDAVTAPTLFIQALIGSLILVAIVVILALIRGERLEADTGKGPGQCMLAMVIICGIFIVGFLIFEPVIDRISPPSAQARRNETPKPMSPDRWGPLQ